MDGRRRLRSFSLKAMPCHVMRFIGRMIAGSVMHQHFKSVNSHHKLERRAACLAIVALLAAPAGSWSYGRGASHVERGQQAFDAEGCAKCHAVAREEASGTGDHREGPDLSRIGERRSALWLKIHLCNPGEVNGPSKMPKYGWLFRDGRGNDLVAYLSSLHRADGGRLAKEQRDWHLEPGDITRADAAEGQHLFNRLCATCHTANGRTRKTWMSSFIEQPALLGKGAIQIPPSSGDKSLRLDHLAHIVKFGIPDSDMAGHESLSEKEIASVCVWLMRHD
jgi:mono/diheme cytochrome c family protein